MSGDNAEAFKEELNSKTPYVTKSISDAEYMRKLKEKEEDAQALCGRELNSTGITLDNRRAEEADLKAELASASNNDDDDDAAADVASIRRQLSSVRAEIAALEKRQEELAREMQARKKKIQELNDDLENRVRALNTFITMLEKMKQEAEKRRSEILKRSEDLTFAERINFGRPVSGATSEAGKSKATYENVMQDCDRFSDQVRYEINILEGATQSKTQNIDYEQER